MSNNSSKSRSALGALVLASAIVCAQAPASAADTPSSPADRQRLVAITHKLEQAPLDAALNDERAWALSWLIEVPDIAVSMCSAPLNGLVQSKYRYSGDIVVQDSLAMAAFQIEHPESANDAAAQQFAGVESALKAYRAILRDKPNARSPALDTLPQTQSQGGLPEFVRKAWTACSAHKGGK